MTPINLLLDNEIEDSLAKNVLFCDLRVLARKLESPSLRKFNLRPLATGCRSVLPGIKVVSDSRVTLPVNFACKPGLSFNPLARVTLAVGLPYLLVNRA